MLRCASVVAEVTVNQPTDNKVQQKAFFCTINIDIVDS